MLTAEESHRLDNIIVPERLAAFLIELPKTAGLHSTGSLLEHLEGTYRLLKFWECPEHVCVAGLFHSIYGTEAYRSRALELSMRSELRELVGAQAEKLVFAFHNATWSELLVRRQALQDTERDTPGLSEIALANLVEQLGRVALAVNSGQREQLAEAARAHLVLEPFVSANAMVALRQLLDDLSDVT